MKKLITIILFIFSIQIFAGQYQVIKQKNVTLSKEQIDLENKKIEERLNNYAKKDLKESLISEFKKVIKDIPEEGYYILLEFFSQLSNFMVENTKIKIKNIKYLSNTKAVVKSKITMPSSDSFDNLNEGELEKKFIKKYNLKEFENTNDLKTLSKLGILMADFIKKEFKEKPSYRVIEGDINLEKVKNGWEIKGI
ncbi:MULTISPECIES: hypothetical protein [unclassified Leptotrichia]|uniref:hypothetical protein n=1 Tax=unclassified Leptotrichia TaxID=2633022 RepID=UPI0003AE1D70|nr:MULTISPECIES: hypothetical protein [unclassified Leptotrichia]ERL25667.1 hypothetical protein HMPREF9108_01788 [Leptotrichia sp. oral taxon 225 str. F0581]WLD74457.1 hypothetical protein QU666_00880 [Leptotrichia sp. HMT-225]